MTGNAPSFPVSCFLMLFFFLFVFTNKIMAPLAEILKGFFSLPRLTKKFLGNRITLTSPRGGVCGNVHQLFSMYCEPFGRMPLCGLEATMGDAPRAHGGRGRTAGFSGARATHVQRKDAGHGRVPPGGPGPAS